MTIHSFVTDVDGVSIRNVFDGQEQQQLDLLIKTKAGTLALRLIGRRGKLVRVTDLRARDKKQTRQKAKRNLVDVSFADVFKTDKGG